MSLLVVMGSGETAPTMVKIHRQVFAETAGHREGPAVMLDTPFGFQMNADDLVARTRQYFADSVGSTVEVAHWRRADQPVVECERALALLHRAGWAFAGPGSPTYALRQWRGTGVPEALLDVARHGGTLVFGSAAACTLGTHAIPVYEIYKVGEEPRWEPGLDLLGRLTGVHAVVIPHFDNAEGGGHDTRFCYLGEQRLAALETRLPDGIGVLGVDEHTALLVDIEARTVRVAGNGVVTVRRRGHAVTFPAGSELSLDRLDALLRGIATAGDDGTPASGDGVRGDGSGGDGASGRSGAASGAAGPGQAGPGQAGPGQAGPGQAGAAADDGIVGGSAASAGVAGVAGTAIATSLAEEARQASERFDAALAARDVDGCVTAVLDLEAAIVAWSSDTLQSDDADRARRTLRAFVVRLGELARVGARDPREALGPFVELLLEVRGRARAARDFATSDLVRDRLTAIGVEVRDTPEGAEWLLSSRPCPSPTRRCERA
jgi:hypothetical protein